MNNHAIALGVITPLLSWFPITAASSHVWPIAQEDVQPHQHKPVCFPIEVIKKKIEGTTFTKATPGQYNFLRGFYVGFPRTPEGLPIGDGAIIVKHGTDPGAIIIWTISDKMGCDPISLPDNKLLDLMKNLKSGKIDSDGNEL